MRAISLPEIRVQGSSSTEVFLEKIDRELSENHVGIPPEKGLKEKGNMEHKRICEDVKLKNLETGLFIVADGVSLASGWFASRMAAKIMFEKLGSELDKGIANNLKEVLRNGESAIDRISKFVAARMIAAVEEADTQIRVKTDRFDFSGSATTLSLSKLVEIPDGHGGLLQRVFFFNIGDSRIYLKKRGGDLRLLTRDDNRISAAVDAGRLTQEQAQMIDQAEDPGKLSDNLRQYLPLKHVLTKAVGSGGVTEDLAILYVDVEPGDRLMILSDGASDQFVHRKLQQFLDDESNDSTAEADIQVGAMEMALDGQHPRAKADDISAIVHTFEEPHSDSESGGARGALASKDDLKAEIQKFRLQTDAAKRKIEEIQTQLSGLSDLTPKRERLDLMVMLEEANSKEALAELNFEKANLDLFDLALPARYSHGDQVSFLRKDFSPPSMDRQFWTVEEYDVSSKRYLLRGAGNVQRHISRYDLELVQQGLGVRVGDILPVRNQIGMFEKGFQVTGIQDDGNVLLEKESRGTLRELSRDSQEIQDTFEGQLFLAQKTYERMVQAIKKYKDAQLKKSEFQAQKKDVELLEQRQQAILRAESSS